MRHELDFWVVGGDQRQACLAGLLAADGHTVHAYALDGAEDLTGEASPAGSLAGLDLADCIVLPLPLMGDGERVNAPLAHRPVALAEVLAAARPGQSLCAGRVEEDARAALLRRELVLRDYFAREELAVANAVPTAEGAIQRVMEATDETIHGSRCLVLGFGRVGRITAQRFAALGARVRVAARKYDQLAWAQAMGFAPQPLSHLAGWLCGYDLVVNTIPAPVLTRRELEDLKPDCLILDLASKPGGVDQTAAGELGLAVIWALALPGKVAPVTAGAAIQTAIYNMLQELGR